MKNFKIVFTVFITLAVIGITGYLMFNYFVSKPGGLLVDTSPNSKVYIDGVLVGKTPFRSAYSSSQINLKLIPETKVNDLVPYETKVNLVPGIQTVVRREFAASEEESSGETISFEKVGGNLAGLLIISNPDHAKVWIDGVSQGSTPYNYNSITTGTHKIIVKAEGYLERTLSIKTIAGLKLTMFVKLAREPDINTSPTPTPVSQVSFKGTVLIGETSTGYVRMRTLPGTKGEEIAELKSGSKYKLIGTDSESGWYNIQYKDPAPGLPNGITGWVSNQYSKILDGSGSVNTPTPQTSSKP